MPKLPVVSARKTIRALERAGFYVDLQVGRPVMMVYPETDRRTVVRDDAGKDLKPGTLRAVRRHAGLTVEEFRRLLR